MKNSTRLTLLSLSESLLASSASAATEIEVFVGNKGVETWQHLFATFE